MAEDLLILVPNVLVARTRGDVVLPLATPVRGLDGKQMNEIFIPKNTKLIVGIAASNRNPALWGPDSDTWKPARWLSPLPDALVKARIPGIYSHLCVISRLNPETPHSYPHPSHSMTFLGGGRACM